MAPHAVISDDKGVAIVYSDRKREGQLVPSQPNLRELVSDHPVQRTLGAVLGVLNGADHDGPQPEFAGTEDRRAGYWPVVFPTPATVTPRS